MTDKQTCEYCGAISDDIEFVWDEDLDVALRLCGACRRVLSVEEL